MGSSSGSVTDAHADAADASETRAENDSAADSSDTGEPADAGDAAEEGNAVDASDASDAGLDAADAEAGPNPVQIYVQQYAQAFCAGQFDCCQGYDAGFDDAATGSCESQVLTGTDMWESTLPTAYNAANLQIDQTQATACLDALNPESCGTITAAQYQAITNACYGVFTGTVAVGGAGCVTSFECASGYCRLPSDGGVGMCTPLVATGGACISQDMCSQASQPPTAYCTGTITGSAGTCAPLLADGEVCGGYDLVCSSGLCTANGSNNCGGNYPNPSVGHAGLCP